MAMAGKRTVVQVQEIKALGELDPEVIVTPGIFVDRVVQVVTTDPGQ
jgi:3-oxoadipate CoA-transferase alpha subunit